MKKKVIVLMGGDSSEYEVSILSGKQVVSNLNPEKYDIQPIIISKEGRWHLTSKTKLLNNKAILKDNNVTLFQESKIINSRFLKPSNDLIVFIAMHGRLGEDGKIQGMLDLMGLRYTGSGVLASSIGMDKNIFRKIMIANNLPIPKYICLSKNQRLNLDDLPFDSDYYFVKPVNGGSSIGASFVKDKNDLKTAITKAFKYDDKILIDEYIDGLEVTCPVLGNEKPIALPVIEIHPLKGDFFDYESKYTESGSEEIAPARISRELTKKIQDLSIKVFKAIGCKGFARIDFILRKSKPFILEINTIPGLTAMSLLPKSAASANISYPDLLDRIINYAK